jgi:hypothetical protein
MNQRDATELRLVATPGRGKAESNPYPRQMSPSALWSSARMLSGFRGSVAMYRNNGHLPLFNIARREYN